jgi:hypothetical protein
MELGSYFLFLQEQIKDIIIIIRPSLPYTQTTITAHSTLPRVWREAGMEGR